MGPSEQRGREFRLPAFQGIHDGDVLPRDGHRVEALEIIHRPPRPHLKEQRVPSFQQNPIARRLDNGAVKNVVGVLKRREVLAPHGLFDGLGGLPQFFTTPLETGRGRAGGQGFQRRAHRERLNGFLQTGRANGCPLLCCASSTPIATNSRIASRTGVALMENSSTSVISTTRWPGGNSLRAMRSSNVSRINSRSDLRGGMGIKLFQIGESSALRCRVGQRAFRKHDGLYIIH